MFEKDVEFIRGTAAQLAFIIELYKGNTVDEACMSMQLNPAAVAFIRSQDQNFDADIRKCQGYTLERLIDKLATIDDSYDDPLMARVVSDNIKWLAGKRRRDIYGEKLDVNHNHVIDIRGAIAAAKQRTIEFIDVKPMNIIDHSTDNISVAQSIDGDDIDPLS